MKKFFAILLIFLLNFANISNIFANDEESISFSETEETDLSGNFDFENSENKKIEYPEGKDFEIMKKIMNESFSENRYGYFFQNYKYTKISEDKLKIIFAKNFEKHPKFFKEIFKSSDHDFRGILGKIPKAYDDFGTNESLASALIKSSFGVEYDYRNNLKNSLEGTIKRFSNNKLHENFHNKAYSPTKEDILKSYPTLEELYEEDIFFNGESKKIGDFKGKFIYKVTNNPLNPYILSIKEEFFTLEQAKEKMKDDELNKATKKDYSKLLEGKKVPKTPEIFKNIPRDSLFLYIKNSKDFFEILEQQSPNSFFGYQSNLASVQDFIKQFFKTDDFKNISENIKDEIVIIGENMDVTAPDFVIIMSKNDFSKVNLPKNYFSKNIGDFVAIAKSENILEKIANLPKEKSIIQASDFQFVWEKKADKIKTSFAFVGDEFFEKHLEMENFVSIYRKLQNHTILTDLQTLTFAYRDIYGKNPNFSELKNLYKNLGNDAKNINEKDFSIDENGIISSTKIGNLKEIKSISQINEKIEKISEEELSAYRSSVGSYREIWSANLDPMGIILNKNGSEVSVDFYMTPLPEILELKEFANFMEKISKKELDFFKNNHLANGILSVAFGIDKEKLNNFIEEKTKDSEKEEDDFYYRRNFYIRMIKSLYGEEEVKKLFEEWGGEIAFSFYGLNDDFYELDYKDIDSNLQNIPQVFVAVNLKNTENFKKHFETLILKERKDFGKRDYKGVEIYALNVAFFKIYYTFIDNYFIIAPNADTLKSIIDSGKDSDFSLKANTFSNYSFVNFFFNKDKFLTFLKDFDLGNIYNPLYRMSDDIDFEDFIYKTYPEVEWNNYLYGGNFEKSFDFGNFSLISSKDGFKLKAEKNFSEILDKTYNKIIEEMKAEGLDESEIQSEIGFLNSKEINLEKFLDYNNNFVKFIFINLFLTNLENSSNSFLKNIAFSLNLGDNEVGFSLKYFDEEGKTNDFSKNILIMVIFASIITLFGIFMFIRKRKKA